MTPGPTDASKPNPGRNTDGVYARAHIFTHDFQATNVTMPTLMDNLELAQKNAESLQGAALITITTPAQAVAGEPLELAVQVTNVGAGHHLPTGVGEVRQMWLELTVHDNQGREIYHSGAIAPDGSLPADAAIFGLVVADVEGTPIMQALADGEMRHQLWQVAQVLEDNRIPARATKTVSYTASVPAGTGGPLQVEAALHFRDAPQAVVNILLGDPAARIPVTEMARDRIVLPVVD